MRSSFAAAFLLVALVEPATTFSTSCPVRRRLVRGAAVASEEEEEERSVEDVVVESLQRLTSEDVDWEGMRAVLREAAYTSHSADWSVTRANARRLGATLPEPESEAFRSMFRRVVVGGGWSDAPPQERPWVVLVGGLNGIRKTTTTYEPWFADALAEALSAAGCREVTKEELPTGGNSFFRQLDFIMATIANVEFEKMYSLRDPVAYAAEKARVFSRYRTAAELFGLVLLDAAKHRRKNVLFETSGRDRGTFDFVEAVYGDDSGYRKLVAYFAVDHLEHAERSVDARMLREMECGASARGPQAVVAANCGGPYGSAALSKIHNESLNVWQTQVLAGDLARDWHKAVLRIHSSDDPAAWTARAADLDDVRLRDDDDDDLGQDVTFAVFAFGSQQT